MTETPNEPATQAEADALTEQRLGGDLQFGGTVLDGWYDPREGPGRWCLLSAHGEPLGYLWTNDAEGLGFAATTSLGWDRTPEFVVSLRRAKWAGSTATEVFDHWATSASLGLQAGPVESGDLDTLGGNA